MKTKHTRPAARILTASILLSTALTGLTASRAIAAEDEAVGMIVELITGSDKDMQTMAIGQVRKQSPGKDATLRFAALLEKLPADAQAKLIDALGARGDAAARSAILKMRDSKNETVRIAAADALSALASPDDIPALVKLAATGSDAEKLAARNTLRKLKGDKMDAAMIAAMKDADAKAKVELIDALTDRNVTTAAPVIIKDAEDADSGVRLAVLNAMRSLGDESHAPVLVKRMKSAEDKKERVKAALAMLSVCRREKAKCAAAVIAGFDGADTATRVLLIRVLTEAGGTKSLDQIVASLKADDKNVSTAALRALAGWPDRAASPHLKVLARDVKNLRTHIMAMRGIVRLAGPTGSLPADLAALGEAMKLATRKEEKVLVLGMLGTIPTAESLTMVTASLDQAELAEDACFAAVLIGEKISKDHKDQAKTAMQKVSKTAKNEKTRARAAKVLQGL
jgi:HEAT repeat protein